MAKLFDTVKPKVHFKGPSECHNLNRINNKMEDGDKGHCVQTEHARLIGQNTFNDKYAVIG